MPGNPRRAAPEIPLRKGAKGLFQRVRARGGFAIFEDPNDLPGRPPEGDRGGAANTPPEKENRAHPLLPV